MHNKIYLAAATEWKATVLDYAEELKELGFEITAEWLYDPQTGVRALPKGVTLLRGNEVAIKNLAIRDLRNILEADALIMFSSGDARIRNTRVAELGIAIGAGKWCYVIGPEPEKLRENIDNIFSLMDELPPELTVRGIKPVQHFNTWEEFKEACHICI